MDIKRNLYVSQTEHIKTIKEALDRCNQQDYKYSIYISPGFYKQRLHIKRQLQLLPNQKVGQIIFSAKENESIEIQLEEGQTVIFDSLKFMSEVVEDKDAEHSMIRVKSGSLIVKNSAFFFKERNLEGESLKIGIQVDQNASLTFVNSKIIGFYNRNTQAIRCMGKLIMEGSQISKHKLGGVYIQNKMFQQTIHIKNCQFTLNTMFGVSIRGQQLQNVIIDQCHFTSNNGVGLSLRNIQNSMVRKCEMVQNLIGLELEGCQIYIFNNLIKKNYFYGIQIKSAQIVDRSVIVMNTVQENQESGVFAQGKGVFTLFRNNVIKHNKHQGMMFISSEQPTIVQNIIKSNQGQGILLKQSSGLIWQNQISFNQQSNLAFGGKIPRQLRIVSNQIFKSQFAGVFMTESNNGLLINNQIYQNQQGLVVDNSQAVISCNKILKNKVNGIRILGYSACSLTRNKIIDNEVVGISVRFHDKIKIFRQNTIRGVKALCTDDDWKFQNSNLITGNIQVMKSNCSLI